MKKRPLYTSLKMFLIMTVLTGVLYPALITIIAQLTMSKHANGNLAYQNEKTIGSFLIAQKITDEKYFWPRPSAIDFNAAQSGGSNLGPTSYRLQEAVKERQKSFGIDAPSEMLYASGSGLDPHISVKNAYYQAERIAKARGKSVEEIKKLIDENREGRQLGFLGPKYVNVLRLNLALNKTTDEHR